jgi:hypothetical protein
MGANGPGEPAAARQLNGKNKASERSSGAALHYQFQERLAGQASALARPVIENEDRPRCFRCLGTNHQTLAAARTGARLVHQLQGRPNPGLTSTTTH